MKKLLLILLSVVPLLCSAETHIVLSLKGGTKHSFKMSMVDSMYFAEKEDQDIEKNKKIVVSKNGESDFISIVEAIYYANSLKWMDSVNIEIHEGVYDMVEEYFDFKNITDYSDTEDVGVRLSDNVNLIGKGNRDSIILMGHLPSDVKYRSSRSFSVINLGGYNNRIENLTITAFNCRYPVHDQSNEYQNNDYCHTFKNCHFIHYGFDDGKIGITEVPSEENNDEEHRWYSCHAVGQGTCNYAKIKFTDCIFENASNYGNAFLTHDAKQENNAKTDIVFEKCHFICGSGTDVYISSLGNGYLNSINFSCCTFKSKSPKIFGKISTSGYGKEFTYQIKGIDTSKVEVSIPK